MTDAHQRRTYLVDRRFQLKYILVLMGCGLGLAVLFGAWAWQAQSQAVELIAPEGAQRALAGHATRQLLSVLAVIAVLAVAALGLVGFILTHRVAGPVYVMTSFLAELGAGRYPSRRSLRKHDELKAFHARFLDVIDALRERERVQLAHLEDAIALMRGAAARAPELAAAVEALEAELKQRRDAIEPTVVTPLPIPAPERKAAGAR